MNGKISPHKAGFITQLLYPPSKGTGGWNSLKFGPRALPC